VALEFSDNFTLLAAINSGDRITIVHIYYDDGSAYLPVATTPVVIGGVQYYGCLKGYSNIGESWQLGIDNLVTLAAPSVEVAELTDPTGFSIIKEMETKSFFGNRIDILEGYDGFALADYALIFTGKIDEPRVSSSGIVFECLTRETPDTVISGGEIDVKANKIGGRAVSSISMSEESDGKPLPVHFGQHWCAAGLCYEQKDTGELRFIFNDPYWSGVANTLYSTPQHATAQVGIRDLDRFNLNQTSKRVLAEMNNRLIPIFETAFSGSNPVFTTGHDTRIDYSSIYANYVEFGSPDDCIQCLDDESILAECPLRFVPAAGASHSLSGTGAARTGSMAYAFDGDADNYMDLEGTTGLITCTLNTRVNLWEQLAHDDIGVPHRGRGISVPSGDVETTAEFWQTLVLGRFKHLTAPGSGQVSIYIELERSALPSIGVTRAGAYSQSGGTQDYNFYSKLYQRDADGSWNEIDLSTDAIGPLWYNGIGDGGNYTGTDTEISFLGAKFFERIIWEDVTFAVKCALNGTGASSGRFYDISLHPIEPVPLDKGGYIYTDYLGFVMPDVATNLLSRFTGDTGSQLLTCPPQYLEAILKCKCGFENFNEDEWTGAADWFDDFFETWRQKSGPQIIERTKLDEFLRDYLKFEPFTVFQDSSGKWRFKKFYRNLTDLEAAETIHTLDYNDCDSIEFGLTPEEQIVSEIKSAKSDYIPGLNDYAVKKHWSLWGGDYAFDFWQSENLVLSNKYALEDMELKYTSSPVVDRVVLDSVSYGCVKTHKNISPNTETTLRTQRHWQPLTDYWTAATAWDNSTIWRGEDCENRGVAETHINQWCNRHRIVKFSSSNVQYKKHEIGDYVQFVNVPDLLLGMNIKGFAGNEDDDTVAVNGQNATYAFVVLDVNKSMNSTVLTCMQYHELDAFRVVERGNQNDDGFTHA
jgi:hypothetical protein